MRRYEVVTRKNIELEIKELVEYISKELENPIAANKLEMKLRKKIFSLKYMPKRNHVVGNIYQVKVEKCKLFYKVTGNYVVLIKITHSLKQLKPEDYL